MKKVLFLMIGMTILFCSACKITAEPDTLNDSNAKETGKKKESVYIPKLQELVISPESEGYYFDQPEITIACKDEGVSIYWTSDGTVPGKENGTLYEGPFKLERSGIIKAVAVKDGFLASDIAESKPFMMVSKTLKMTVRDFRGYNSIYTGKEIAGNITQELIDKYDLNEGNGYFRVKYGHPDFERTTGTSNNRAVEELLDSEGKPVLLINEFTKKMEVTPKSFSTWYRDFPGINLRFEKEFELTKSSQKENTWIYSNSSFFPINGEGFGNDVRSNTEINYGFTTETVINFLFEGNEEIKFAGDDDVYIFINGKIAIEMGGCHGSQASQIFLGYTSENVNEIFGLEYGKTYEVKIFHAERHTTSSNYELQFTGKFFN